MTNITEMLQNSELRTAILNIANSLENDSNYTKKMAIQTLLRLLEEHNLY